MYIYADILILTNIYIDYLLIKTVALISRSPLKTLRGLSAAFIGSLFSLMIFLPKLPFAILSSAQLLSSALIVYTAFGFNGKASFLKRMLIFFICAAALGGIGYAAAQLCGGKMIISRNGVIYADFSAKALIISSVIAYGAIAVYRYFSSFRLSDSYTIIIKEADKLIGIPSAPDTGNSLRDIFSGKPVIVCPRASLSELYTYIPNSISEEIPPVSSAAKHTLKWRFIPYSTASGKGVIPIICPDEIYIKNNDTGSISPADACIGAADEDMPAAVFNPELLF